VRVAGDLATRDPEPSGDLGRVEVLHVPQVQHSPLPLVEVLERLRKEQSVLGGVDRSLARAVLRSCLG
jgi:hypothetical protein